MSHPNMSPPQGQPDVIEGTIVPTPIGISVENPAFAATLSATERTATATEENNAHLSGIAAAVGPISTTLAGILQNTAPIADIKTDTAGILQKTSDLVNLSGQSVNVLGSIRGQLGPVAQFARMKLAEHADEQAKTDQANALNTAAQHLVYNNPNNGGHIWRKPHVSGAPQGRRELLILHEDGFNLGIDRTPNAGVRIILGRTGWDRFTPIIGGPHAPSTPAALAPKGRTHRFSEAQSGPVRRRGESMAMYLLRMGAHKLRHPLGPNGLRHPFTPHRARVPLESRSAFNIRRRTQGRIYDYSITPHFPGLAAGGHNRSIRRGEHRGFLWTLYNRGVRRPASVALSGLVFRGDWPRDRVVVSDARGNRRNIKNPLLR